MSKIDRTVPLTEKQTFKIIISNYHLAYQMSRLIKSSFFVKTFFIDLWAIAVRHVTRVDKNIEVIRSFGKYLYFIKHIFT